MMILSVRSLRSLAHKMFLKRLCMANGTFCYLVSIIAVVSSRNRNMTFVITINA